MKYVKLVLVVHEKHQENVIANLADLGLDAFEQQENKLIIYIPKQSFNEVNRQLIDQILDDIPGKNYIDSTKIIANQNWNRKWEQTIEAQRAGPFFIKPTWSPEPVPEHSILLKIDPKMAFGTGYHESTRLMLRMLPETIKKGDRVMDAGTGTGILAIASAKLDAENVFAFDIDEWSIANVSENVLLNEVADRITIKQGSGEVIPCHESFNVILANIERNPILEMVPRFSRVLENEGVILLSGLLESDRQTVSASLNNRNFRILKVIRENEWIAFKAEKKQ